MVLVAQIMVLHICIHFLVQGYLYLIIVIPHFNTWIHAMLVPGMVKNTGFAHLKSSNYNGDIFHVANIPSNKYWNIK